MMLYLIILWALVGYSGFMWSPIAPTPAIPRQTDRRWIMDRFLNMIGAVVGGLLWNYAWPVAQEASPGLGAAVSCIGAVVGAASFAVIVSLIWPRS